MKAYNEHRPHGKKPLFCYVPFNNISFSFKGRVLACAYNQKVELGKYPEQTIHEMWFNSEMGNSLRNHMEHNDLNFGCKHCKYFAEHRKFSGLKPLVFDQYSDYQAFNYPRVMEFELSSTCNFECIMCNGEVSSSIRKNRDGLPALKVPYDDAFVNQLEEFIPHLREAKFYGGEPLLIPIYYKIWELMLELNPDIKIFTITNGSVMNNRVKQLLEKGNFDLAVSMDSTTRSRLESIRKNVNQETLLENIDYFNAYCQKRNKNLVISFTMMRINWQDFPEMIRFCNEKDAILYVSYLKTPPRFALWNLPPNELRNIRVQLEGLEFPSRNYVESHNAQCFADLITYLKNAELENLERDASDIVPMEMTEKDPYSYLPLMNPKAALTDQGVSNSHYIPSRNYRELLAEKLVDSSSIENNQVLAFWSKVDRQMENLPDDIDSNRVYFSMYTSPAEELVQNVSNYTDEELLQKIIATNY